MKATLGDDSLFPEMQGRVFLNHAAISSPSVSVRAQVDAFLRDYAGGGVRAFKAWLPQKERFKGKLAQLIGASESDLAFVANTTTGISLIATCMPWKEGDKVLLFRGEFPANVTPWQQAAKAFGLEIVWADLAFDVSFEAGMEAFQAALRQHAPRLVATSFVRFQSGLRLPVHAMAAACHEHGSEIFVDGIQGIGAVPLHVGAIDYVAWGGHKWMMGLEGLGYLYVSPARIGSLVPRIAGWLSHENALDFLFLGEGHLKHDLPLRAEASAFELGAMAGICAAGAEPALDLILQLGCDAIFAHINAFHDALEPVLKGLGFTSERRTDPRLRSASLCVRHPEVSILELAESLNEAGVHVTTPDGRLRFAPHWWTPPQHVDAVLEALRRAMD